MRFEINAHKPFSICGYSFQNELGIQRDGGFFGPGSSNRGGERPVGRGFQRGQAMPFQRIRSETGKANKASSMQTSLEFIQQKQSPETIISAVVHVDEKTPHMHLCFVPLTADGRLSAKDIIGNRKKLTQWQDEFWKHIVKKYPDFERGESASETDTAGCSSSGKW